METNIVFLFCFAILLCFTFYMFIHFTYMLVSLSNLNKKQKKQDKIITFDSKYLETLLNKAITVLKKNANAFAYPDFYDQQPSIIISTIPDFINVIKLCKYIKEYPESNKYLTSYLQKTYGERFERSPQLNVLVTIKMSEYGSEEKFHYILIDIEKSAKYYDTHKEFFDKLMKQNVLKEL